MSIATNDLMATLTSQANADKIRRERLANAALSSIGPTTGPGALGSASAQVARRPVVGQQSAARPASSVGGSVGGWIQQAAKAMNRQFSPQEIAALNLMIQRESSGNPNAINRWDSNARAGHPSQGLMQTIPSTFAQYALPGYNRNILDPVSNIIAGIRYAQARYGGLLNVPGVRAVNAGGKYRGY